MERIIYGQLMNGMQSGAFPAVSDCDDPAVGGSTNFWTNMQYMNGGNPPSTPRMRIARGEASQTIDTYLQTHKDHDKTVTKFLTNMSPIIAKYEGDVVNSKEFNEEILNLVGLKPKESSSKEMKNIADLIMEFALSKTQPEEAKLTELMNMVEDNSGDPANKIATRSQLWDRISEKAPQINSAITYAQVRSTLINVCQAVMNILSPSLADALAVNTKALIGTVDKELNNLSKPGQSSLSDRVASLQKGNPEEQTFLDDYNKVMEAFTAFFSHQSDVVDDHRPVEQYLDAHKNDDQPVTKFLRQTNQIISVYAKEDINSEELDKKIVDAAGLKPKEPHKQEMNKIASLIVEIVSSKQRRSEASDPLDKLSNLVDSDKNTPITPENLRKLISEKTNQINNAITYGEVKHTLIGVSQAIEKALSSTPDNAPAVDARTFIHAIQEELNNSAKPGYSSLEKLAASVDKALAEDYRKLMGSFSKFRKQEDAHFLVQKFIALEPLIANLMSDDEHTTTHQNQALSNMIKEGESLKKVQGQWSDLILSKLKPLSSYKGTEIKPEIPLNERKCEDESGKPPFPIMRPIADLLSKYVVERVQVLSQRLFCGWNPSAILEHLLAKAKDENLFAMFLLMFDNGRPLEAFFSCDKECEKILVNDYIHCSDLKRLLPSFSSIHDTKASGSKRA
eukprot:Nk52_evm2s649 gene=Nk52_evmTU2s649